MTAAYPRVAVVTGADSGIGAATARLLADEGFDVGITYHSDADGAEATRTDVERRGQRCAVVQQDVADLASDDAVGELIGRLGGIGVLVNNAGTGSSGTVLDTDLDTWRTVVATDLDGAFVCAQRAGRTMVEQGQGGRIIFVTSVHEHVPRRGAAAYCAAKAGLGMFAKVLALELADHAITVNSVAPGEVATEMTGQAEADAWHARRPGNPLGHPGHVVEIASVIGFLASPRASYVTGASYAVDGGLMLMAAHGHDNAGDDWRNP